MTDTVATQPKTQAFSFGEAEQVNSYYELLTHFQCVHNGSFYELPYSINAHAKYFYTLLYLRSALQLKADILTSCYIPHPLLDRQEFAKLAIDYLWFGNAYTERVLSRTGKLLQLKHSPAKYTRADKDGNYKFITQPHQFDQSETIHSFSKDSIHHLLQPDVNQEIYGVPEWLPAVQSAQLNEAATKFRLRYYNNGSHAGYILYITDPQMNEDDIDELKTALKNSKGPGNFRNLMLYSPNGEKDGLKLLPISEVAAKDEFFNIKSVSRDDQLAAARVPPNILGIVPTNTSGFGPVIDAAKVFARNEVLPLQNRFTAINSWLGQEVIAFVPYKVEPDDEETKIK